MKNNNHPLKTGTKVPFDISQGLTVGEGIIVDVESADCGWLYHLDLLNLFKGAVDDHRNAQGELWVCEHEVDRAMAKIK